MKKNNTRTLKFPIVGVGSSAGGLEAFSELLKNLPPNPGIALILATHLAPEHKSMLSDLLSRKTKLPVIEASHNLPVQINQVYVIPPNYLLAISGNKLSMQKRSAVDPKNMAIDYLFQSLAKEQNDQSCGVILSGTGQDGTLGAQAIKSAGGIIFAQDLNSANYADMPQSVVKAGLADFVLSPQKIAKELALLGQRPKMAQKGFAGIFEILRSTKRVDFTYYKSATLHRRIARRMTLLKIKHPDDYVKLLGKNNEEIEKLYADLLINVTRFFRDPIVFACLKKKIFPSIIKAKNRDSQIRIWIPGCASGEEAYSIAICLLEALDRKNSSISVQIFATDINESSLKLARQGIYGTDIEKDVSPEILKKFFVRDGATYRVSKQLREMCVFSKQNVFSDPPFSNIDLISCRNLLIYLQPVLQDRVFRNFGYALRPGGFLLLGNSEDASNFPNLFKAIDRKKRIFVKKYQPLNIQTSDQFAYYPPLSIDFQGKLSSQKSKPTELNALADQLVISEVAPCGVLVDGEMEIIQFRGKTGRYLESAPGKPTLNLFKLAREGLFLPLRNAIRKAQKSRRAEKIIAEKVKHNGHSLRVKIIVIPIKARSLEGNFFLVLFAELSQTPPPNNSPGRGGKSTKSKNQELALRRELQETKQYLQTVIEEHARTNDEVNVANEEILSSNEELQSTNEELLTAKEELQSTNEELITTNEELQNRNAEVSLLNNDLLNLFASIEIPIIMLDINLIIRRITPQSEKTLNIISSDIGRPINKIKLTFDIQNFEELLHEVIATLHPKSIETQNTAGRWFSVTLRPYRTADNKIEGVIAFFYDITQSKNLAATLAHANEDIFLNVIENTSEGIALAGTQDQKFLMVNSALCKLLGYSKDELLHLGVSDIHPINDLPYVLEQFEKQRRREITCSLDLPVKKKDGTVIYCDVNSSPITIEAKTYLMGFFHDTTERRLAEQALQKSEALYKALIETTDTGYVIVDSTGTVIDANHEYVRLTGHGSLKDILGHSVLEWTAEYEKEKNAAAVAQCAKDGFIRNLEIDYVDKNGQITPIEINATVINTNGTIRIHTLCRDISERRKNEAALKQLKQAVDTSDEIIFITNRDGLITYINSQFTRVYGFTAEEVVNKTTPRIIKSGALPPENYKIFWDTIIKDNLAKGEIINKRKDGSLVTVGSSVTSIHDHRGNIIGFLAIQRDITEQKQAEEARRENAVLKKLNTLKSDFVATVSHELRTPLATIEEGINLMVDKIPGEINQEQNHLLGIMKNNLGRLARIINNLLNISRIESGKTVLKNEPIDLNKVINNLVAEFTLRAKAKPLELRAVLPQPKIEIYGDPDKIVEIFSNLIANALKFTEKGSIEIAVKELGSEVECSVTDTGIGIDEHDLPFIFDKFQQFSPPPDSSAEKGTGLGLAIVKGLVEAHHGNIRVESKKNQGTSFIFTLPMHHQEQNHL